MKEGGRRERRRKDEEEKEDKEEKEQVNLIIQERSYPDWGSEENLVCRVF